jgi:DNA repair exonuclease SbcCD ATPase subunit
MDTYRIYEQFKVTLGDDAAKALAETLGGMAEELRDSVTKEDFRTLRESIDADTARLESALVRLAEAQERTEVRLEQLTEAQQRTEGRVDQLEATMLRLAEAQERTESRVDQLDAAMLRLAEAQERTESRVDQLDAAMLRLTEAQERTDAKVAELAEAQVRTEASLTRLDASVDKLTAAQAEMASALQRLTIRTDDVVGRTFELQFRDRLTAYLGRFLRRGKIVPNDQLLEEIEPHLSKREIDSVLSVDVIAYGRVEGEPTYVVVEVSWTGDTEDIVRADERAKLLRQAGLAAIPLVACNAISPESTAMAKLRQVRIWCNGSLLEAAA